MQVIAQPLRDWMIGCHSHKARTENRIGPRCVNGQLFAIGKLESELEPAGFADPVFLHQPDFVRPVFQIAKAFKQVFGKVSDFEEPLVKLALFNFGAAAPSLAINDLLIGKHCHIDRVPVHFGLAAANQPSFIHIEEKRLLMPVIFRVASGELACPVERKSDPLQLRFHRLDIGAGPVAGMNLLLHRSIFSRHSESIPAHRMQHFKPAHRLIARQHIAHRVIADMAHMDAPAGIGEHFQHIALGLCAIAIGCETGGIVPHALPARVGLARLEALLEPAVKWRLDHRESLERNSSGSDSLAAQIARFGEDNVLKLLHSGRLHRRVHPCPALSNLATGRNPQGIGAQILIEDCHGHFHTLARIARIGVPIGHNHTACAIGLKQRREADRVQRGTPQIGIDADGVDLAGCQISAWPL